ncbi:hypothetical protein, partial [Listeria booriae]|uniref:hypothetical protein n=1 Tax=Listeria booriae TaxID=1552123 RepID=UPI001C8A51AD
VVISIHTQKKAGTFKDLQILLCPSLIALKTTHFYDILNDANEFMVVGSLLFMKVGGAYVIIHGFSWKGLT